MSSAKGSSPAPEQRLRRARSFFGRASGSESAPSLSVIRVLIPEAGDLIIGVAEDMSVTVGVDAEPTGVVRIKAADWDALVEGSDTMTDLWFRGAISAERATTLRNEYMRFFAAIRIAQNRPRL